MDALAYRPAQAAKVVNLSRSTFYELIKSGEVRAFKVGAATLITADELRRWLSDRERHAADRMTT